MIYINAKYTTDSQGEICIEPERQLTPEEAAIVIEINIYDDVYHYKTIND